MWVNLRTLAAATVAACLMAAGTADAQQCINDYQRTLKALANVAGECAKNNKLMTQLTDVMGLENYGQGSPGAAPVQGPSGWTGIDTGKFNRDSAHDFHKYLTPNDPRWRMEGTKAFFNCGIPLSPRPMPQNEAFLECYRVMLCASHTTMCAINTARSTGSKDCAGITGQCMLSHPIPQGQMGPTIAERAAPPPQGDGSRRSAPPPNPADGLTAACKTQLNQFLEAADRNDGTRAAAAYQALRANCDGVMHQIAQAGDMSLPERQTGRLAKGSFSRCLSGVDCGTAPSSPDQMAAAAANAFNIDEVMNFAFTAAGFAMGVAGVYAPLAGGQIMQSNRFSTINQRARSTYGQGGPGYVAPRTVPSDITGTGGDNRRR
ncbi:MAG: hypothetical protein EPO67_12900 [Reyranella sp.]|jgi:hypothetical protein|nr:MAG: hypothetical protein EPO67_12900 [Reyranella sp.]